MKRLCAAVALSLLALTACSSDNADGYAELTWDSMTASEQRQTCDSFDGLDEAGIRALLVEAAATVPDGTEADAVALAHVIAVECGR